MELSAARGLAMVAGVPLSAEVPGGRLWGLPPELVSSLQEWARVADGGVAVGAGGMVGSAGGDAPGGPAPVDTDEPDGPFDGPTVSRRGRHLAARLSAVLGVPVDYCDPVTGHRIPLRAVTRTPYPPPVALPPRGQAPRPVGEPTPWGSGLTLSVIAAGLVLLANLALASPMITRLGWIGVLVDLLVAAGLVPALWLNRRVPTWRWVVFGTIAGMVLALPFLAVQASTGS